MSDDLAIRLRNSTEWWEADCELKMKCADRIEELEAKLAVVVGALEHEVKRSRRHLAASTLAALAEIKGEEP